MNNVPHNQVPHAEEQKPVPLCKLALRKQWKHVNPTIKEYKSNQKPVKTVSVNPSKNQWKQCKTIQKLVKIANVKPPKNSVKIQQKSCENSVNSQKKTVKIY